jgi:serine/threonine-protein kinase
VPGYPLELEQVVLKALQKQPEDRFASALELLTALDSACPSALSPGFDSEVAAYMAKLFGPKASERRAAIRSAQNEVDRVRHDAAASSVGTLRAISISQDGSHISLTPTPASGKGSPLVEPSFQAPPSKRIGVAIVAASMAVALAAVVQMSRSSAPTASAAASSPVPRDMATLESPRPVPSASAAAVTSATATDANLDAPLHESAADGVRKKAGRAGRVAPSVKAQPLSAAPSSTTSPTTAPAVGKPESPPAASVNAWDRGAFGGRH